MPETYLEFAVMNIKASPHPEGIYPKLLKRISHTPTHVRGDDYLAITPPERAEGGFYRGRITVWTDLDPKSPAINKETLEALSLADAHVTIAANIGINLRVFAYVLRERDHLLFFETKNEDGKTLSPYTLEKTLGRMFWPVNEKGEIQVEVNVQRLIIFPVPHPKSCDRRRHL